MSQELTAVTGKCKLKRHSYPVRIYANDGGQSRDMIHGAYKDKDGWHVCTWDADGSPRFATINNDKALINIPPPVFFNIYTDFVTGQRSIGMIYKTLPEATDACKLWRTFDAETFRKDDDKIKLIATYTNPRN